MLFNARPDVPPDDKDNADNCNELGQEARKQENTETDFFYREYAVTKRSAPTALCADEKGECRRDTEDEWAEIRAEEQYLGE
jgi:hypothetical protein